MSETFDLARWRPAPLLPERETRDAALVFVVAVLCYLACVTGLAVIAADRAASGWSRQLGAEATVIVRARAGETPDEAAARAAETLAGVPGVSEARALEPKKAFDLVRPWLGDVADVEDLPVPRLVAVSLEARHPATAPAMRQALSAQGLDTVVDDHSLWVKDVRRAAGVARTLACVVFLLIAAAAGAVVAFATRAGLAAQRQVVEVLHLTGAEEGFIAGIFQARFARAAALAGLIGAAAALVTGALLRLAGGADGLTPALPIAWADLLAVLPCPALAAGVAALSARITAQRLMRPQA
jgi:cell division transport system permease protein